MAARDHGRVRLPRTPPERTGQGPIQVPFALEPYSDSDSDTSYDPDADSDDGMAAFTIKAVYNNITCEVTGIPNLPWTAWFQPFRDAFNIQDQTKTFIVQDNHVAAPIPSGFTPFQSNVANGDTVRLT